MLPDLNYDGRINLQDLTIAAGHSQHWHRQALFGTPVRRTNLTAADYGEGHMTWEPNGDRIGFTFHNPYYCQVFLMHSDPSPGNVLTQITYADSFDYDPCWTPRTQEIIFDRSDYVIYRKAIADSAVTDHAVEHAIIAGVPNSYNTTQVALSPDGRTIAYQKLTFSPFTQNIYTVSILGGTPTAVTSYTSTSGISATTPQWSPDGTSIVFTGIDGSGHAAIYRVPADGSSAPTVIFSAASRQSKVPSLSPDGLVLAARIDSAPSQPALFQTLDPSLASPVAIPNFTAFPAEYIYPMISPDGTRAAFAAPPPGSGSGALHQIWAVRRNMDLPPALYGIGDKVVTEGSELTFTVSATDPEGDAIGYHAAYLQPGMSFVNQVFSWTPGTGTAGHSYWVKLWVTEASGGTASEVIKISVIQSGLAGRRAGGSVAQATQENPTRGPLQLMAPGSFDRLATLSVYTVAGRLVGLVTASGGHALTWDGNTRAGQRVPPGMYLYRVTVAGEVYSQGKITLVR